MYTKFSLIKFDKKSYDYLVIIAMPHCVDAIIFGEKLSTVRSKNFRDDEFRKSRKFLVNLESFHIGVKNVCVSFLESF